MNIINNHSHQIAQSRRNTFIEINNLPITSKEIKLVIKILPRNKSQEPCGFIG